MGGTLLVLVGAFTGSYALGTLGMLLLATIGIAWLWARFSLKSVRYERSLSASRVYAGESVSLEVSITNAKPLTLPWLLVEDRLDARLVTHDLERTERTGREYEIRHTVSVGWYERVRWRYQVECPRRGLFAVGPASLRSGDPFGFYEESLQPPGTLNVLVYPRLLPLQGLDLGPRFPFDGSRAQALTVTDPFSVVGARPYTDGDTLRQVHWRASARSLQLQSKVITPVTDPSVLIFLDLTSSLHAWQGINTEVVERAISTAATLAHRVRAASWGLGLFVNGLQGGTAHRVRIGAARGDDSLARVLEVLARVPPYPSMPFADLIRAERSRLPAGSTVVAISALRSEAVTSQLEACRRSGAHVLTLHIHGMPQEAGDLVENRR